MTPRTLFIAVLVVLGIGTAAYYRFMPPPLTQVPDIRLVSIDGEKLHLPAYRGRPLLVTFWSTTCPSCVREMPHLAKLYRDLAPRGLQIIAIAMAYDPPDQVVAMRRLQDIPYPVTLDIHADAARAFGHVRVTPTSFLIAPDGRVVQHSVGRLDMTGLRRKIVAMLSEQTGPKAEPAFSGP
jgi:peroxiredoxin